MNPIYSAWNKCCAETRYEFLKMLYSHYDGMLVQAIDDIKKEQKRQRNESTGNLLFGVCALFRNLRKRFF
jgi:hypothetical protein